MSAEKPRFFVQSLTGYGESYRKPTTSWSVYDRAYNCARVATFIHHRNAEHQARQRADELNHQEDA